MKNHRLLLTILLMLSLSPLATAQEVKVEMERAKSLHIKYEFEKAASIYKTLLEKSKDSTERVAIEKQLILSENGCSMMEFADTPHLLASKQFDSSTFFLHYAGFKDSSWVMVPRELLGEYSGNGGYPYMQYSKAAESLIYSAPDKEGKWHIYSIKKLSDTLWSAPAIMNDNVTSGGNDIFPIISRDGKKLYFSSDGHYGIGGYDLYVSEWESSINDWGIPQNMGIPYSSPSNDYLFYDTPDGNFSIFASDRDGVKGKLSVYALKFENMPIKKRMSAAQALATSKMKLSQTEEEGEERAQNQAANPQNEQISEYTAAVEKVKEVKARLSDILAKQKANRDLYNTLTNADDLVALQKKISELEIATISVQAELGDATKRLQNIEMDFLAKGIFIAESSAPAEEREEESAIDTPKFQFANNRLGKTPLLNTMEPVKEINLEFAILEETEEILDESQMPDGLVYQIQLYTLSKPVSGLKALKGLSPVFERKLGSKYTYSVGAFEKYSQALAALPKVRKKGFPSAVVKAYFDKKGLSTTNARAKEKEIANNATYQIIIDGYETLPQEVMTVIRTSTEKDIAKGIDSGRTLYMVGPFKSMAEAEKIVTLLKAVSDQIITIQKVEQ